MDIKRLEKVLAEKSIMIESFSEINFGINSYAWKIKTREKFYFLKCYKSNEYDKRDRLLSEFNFLKLLELGGFKNVPHIVNFDNNDRWILLDWIEGIKVQSPTKKDWLMMVDFIIQIQNLRNLKWSKKILNASEACFEIMDHFCLIKKRLNKLINELKNQSINPSIISWLENDVNSSLENCLLDIKELLKKNQSSKYLIKKILSPSDVGFHNVIKKNQALFFHDFEYAGWDDPHKLLVDLIIQPENVTSIEIAQLLIDSFTDSLKVSNNISDLRILIRLYRVKWVCIILKKINLNSDNHDKLFKKSLDYFMKVGNLWNL